MSTACARFKQNAWKKEMCSNCYKTKDEHQEKPRAPAPLLPLLPASQGILKGWEGGSARKRKNVSFPPEESSVIGYGGEQCSSDEEWESTVGGESDPEESCSDPEEERRLARITRTNTDFNSVPANLTDDRPPPPSMNREPVLVTVTPFAASQHLTRLLQDTAPTITPQETPKEPAAQEPRRVSITRGTVLTKHSETAKNKLYIQNIIAAKDKKVGLGLDKVYISSETDDPEDVVAAKNLANLVLAPTKISSVNNTVTMTATVDTVKTRVEPILSETRKIPGDEIVDAKKGITEICESRKVLPDLEEPMESREMAGEPDGKADSDGGEAGATPPPRSSFLHTGKRQAPQPPAPESPRLVMDSPPPPTRIALDYPPVEVSPLRRLSDLTASTPSPVEEAPPIRPMSLALDPPSPLRIAVPPPESPRRDPPPPPPPTPPAIPSPPTPPTAPSPSPPEPLPRHKGSTFIDVEKKKTKMKETIRKLLRFGSRDEMEVEAHSPRPRPQIIHPIDLNKSAVQVLPSSNPNNVHQTGRTGSPEGPGRPGKPPPPPRSESLHLIERLRSRTPAQDGIYANLGEARSGIAPTKPARTGSLRESSKIAVHTTEVQASDIQMAEPDYEAVSSSTPECDRTSLPYYGSETESDTYSHTLFSRERWSVRRGRSIVVHPSEVDNINSLAEINYHSLRNIQRQQMGERSRCRVDLDEFTVDGERTDLGRGAVAVSVERQGTAATLLMAAAPTALVLPPAVSRSFASTLPATAFPNLAHPVHGEAAVLERAVAAERLTSWAAAAEEEAALVLVQALQIADCLALPTYAADAFVVLSDTERRPTVAYLHRQDEAANGGVSWRAVAALASEGAAPTLASHVCAAAGPEAALAAATAWLWGPPASLPAPLLSAWLALQRAALLASLLTAEPTLLDSLHLAFLAAPVDLDALKALVSTLDPPDVDSNS